MKNVSALTTSHLPVVDILSALNIADVCITKHKNKPKNKFSANKKRQNFCKILVMKGNFLFFLHMQMLRKEENDFTLRIFYEGFCHFFFLCCQDNAKG